MKNVGDGRRVARVEREVQTTIAQFLVRGFKSALPGLVTVSQVKMPGDLRTAKVYVSVLGSDEEQKTALKTLQDRAFEIQNYIGNELKMRFCPKLTFYPDHQTAEVLKVEKILAEIQKDLKIPAGHGLDADSEVESETDSDDE